MEIESEIYGVQSIDRPIGFFFSCTKRFFEKMDDSQINIQPSSKDKNIISVEDSNADNDIDNIDSENFDINKKGKKKRKLTSTVWQHFESIGKSADGKARCKCKKCNSVFLCDSKYGTGNLRRHIDNCVRRDIRDVGQMIFNNDLALKKTSFDPILFREMLISAIVMHDLPLSFVEYRGIKSLFAYLRDTCVTVTRNTIKADLLKMYRREKLRMKNMFEDQLASRISLTSDLWTSIATDGYVSLTAHFVDKNWTLQKRLLNFSHMPPPHSGVALTQKISSLLVDWGIEKKLFTVTLDNASANDTFVGLLKDKLNDSNALVCSGEFFHVRCCAHIINLIVQDGLKEADNAIEKARESVKYIKGSQVRKKKFLEAVTYLNMDGKKGLKQDVPTRWNSTYHMLESCVYYRRAFCHLQLSDSNYKHCPSVEEWDKIVKIMRFLEVFYDITCVFSGVRYPTANLYFPSVFMAYMTLKESMEGDDIFMRKMAFQMFEKFDKYWSKFSIILAIALILDPRYKIHFVDWSYKKLYGLNSHEFIEVRDKLFQLYNEYEAINFSELSSQSTRTSISQPLSEGSSTGKSKWLKEFDTFHSDEYGISTRKSQLEQYLDEPRLDRTLELDVLGYWKTNNQRYPIIAIMARDILSIPISTVASESAFSGGGRVLDQYRSSLKPSIVEALLCTRDWLYGEAETAEKISLDELTEDVMNLEMNEEDISTRESHGSGGVQQSTM